MGVLTREEGLSYAVCTEEVVDSELLSLIPNAPMVTVTCSATASLLVKRLFCCKGNPQALWILLNYTADRGENQREKSKVSLLPVSTYYTTLSCTRTHYFVHTDPMLHRPLTDSGCTYTSYFTSTVTLGVKAGQGGVPT